MAARLGDLSEAVSITHDGDELPARPGEPLALSLIAADRLLLSRSPKLHRPRGPYCLRGACEGCLVRIDGQPNRAACRSFVRGGERVETQNVLGTRKTDLLAAADFLFPQGIDHHRLMAGVRGVSAVVSSFARRIAGLGRLADAPLAVTPSELVEIPVLIAGGGAAGLAAATSLGPRAMLVDDGAELGGALLALDPARAAALAGKAHASGALLLPQSSVLALSREPPRPDGRFSALVAAPGRTLVVRCEVALVCSGLHDATPSFANNELPGIFSARAALFAWRHDVLVGRRVALVGEGPYLERLGSELSGAVETHRLASEEVAAAIGRDRVRAVDVDGARLRADALVFDGRGAPSFELAVQGGAALRFDPGAGYFPLYDEGGRAAPGLYVAGAMAGAHDAQQSGTRVAAVVAAVLTRA
jgi:sarcosine oxidase subunit alpha